MRSYVKARDKSFYLSSFQIGLELVHRNGRLEKSSLFQWHISHGELWIPGFSRAS